MLPRREPHRVDDQPQARSRPTDLHRRNRHLDRNGAAVRGRAPRGERLACGRIPARALENRRFCCGPALYSSHGAPCVIDGPMNGNAFLAYVEQSWRQPSNQATSSCWTISAPTRCRGYVKRSKPQTQGYSTVPTRRTSIRSSSSSQNSKRCYEAASVPSKVSGTASHAFSTSSDDECANYFRTPDMLQIKWKLL